MNLTSPKTFDLPWLDRTLNYLSGDIFNKHMNGVVQALMVPLIAFGVFLMLWSAGARNVETSLGQLPGPAKVWEQVISLYHEHKEERAKEEAFYSRMQQRLDKAIAAGKPQEKLDKLRSQKIYRCTNVYRPDYHQPDYGCLRFRYRLHHCNTDWHYVWHESNTLSCFQSDHPGISSGVPPGMVAAGNHGGVGCICNPGPHV